jgi:hypothetical protein
MNDVYQSLQLTERSLWSGCVQRMFETLDLHEHPAAQDISESLAVFCQQHERIQGHSLALLMARSFYVSGDPAAAGRILQQDRTHRLHADSWLKILPAEYPFPELYPLFAARILRPQSLASAGTLWILDFERVQLTEADRHELVLFQTVRVLTEKTACVWGKTDGRGTLGINGLHRLTRMVRGRQASSQLLGHIRDVLALRARKNGWADVPSVLLLHARKRSAAKSLRPDPAR